MWADSPSPLVLAHRGYHVGHRENTLDAFDAAILKGAHGVEFDVRAARDGALVVHHDESLRKGGARVPVRSLGKAGRPSWLPTLEAVAKWARPLRGVLLDVEIKEPGIEGEAVRVLGREGLLDRVVVTSFHPDVCCQVREHFPNVPTGFITEEAAPAVVDIAHEAGAQVLALDRRIAKAGLVSAARSRGLEVWAWTVNRPAEAKALVALGVRSVITDRPDRVLGAWARPRASPPPRTSLRTGRRGS